MIPMGGLKVKEVRLFGDKFIENAAHVAHEVNRAYCAAIGDDSQQAWEDAPEWQKASAVKGARLHLYHPETGPEASHESWLKEKQETGWKHGPVKDAEKKEHPCMVPYAQLPKEQQVKDHLFRATIRAIGGIK